MNCSEVQKQIDSMFDGELDFAAKRKTENHLKQCHNCRQTYERLWAANEMLSVPVAVPDPAQLDKSVMSAFQLRHFEKPEVQKLATVKNTNWLAALMNLSSGSRATLAAAAILLFILSVGAAYQFGKMSVSEAQAQLSPAGKDNLNLPPVANVAAVKPPALSSENENRESAAPRFIKVPVIKEKIKTRIIYVYKPRANDDEKRRFPIPRNESFALTHLAQKNEIFTETNLKGFQFVSNSETRIIKKGQNYEN